VVAIPPPPEGGGFLATFRVTIPTTKPIEKGNLK
jgi:hypothetical protein